MSKSSRSLTPESALWAVMSHGNGLHLIRWADGSRWEDSYFPVHHEKRWTSMAAFLRPRQATISLVPRIDRHLDAIGTSTVLWARIEDGLAGKALRMFRPQPTLVIQDGKTVKRLAVWWLETPLTYDWCLRANKRIAHALKTSKKWGDPEALIPWERPVLIHANADLQYKARHVVGRLRDAPEPKNWRRAA